MKRNPIQLLNREQLKVLPTKALLGRLRRLHQCEESFVLSDKDESEICSNTIQFKDTSEWQTAYKELKEILKSREHLPKGKDAKALKLKTRKAEKYRVAVKKKCN